MHAAAPAKLHLRRQTVEIDLVLRIYRREANRENACQPPGSRLRTQTVGNANAATPSERAPRNCLRSKPEIPVMISPLRSKYCFT